MSLAGSCGGRRARVCAQDRRWLKFLAGSESAVDDFGACVGYVTKHIHTSEESYIGGSKNNVAHWAVWDVGQCSEGAEK